MEDSTTTTQFQKMESRDTRANALETPESSENKPETSTNQTDATKTQKGSGTDGTVTFGITWGLKLRIG